MTRLSLFFRFLLVLATSLAAGAVCLTGILITTPGLGDQTVWFICSVAVLLLSALLLWTFNCRKIILSGVDAAAVCFFAWYLFCYCINRCIAVSTLLEFCFLAFAYLSFRVLFSSYRYAGIWLFVVLCFCGSIEAVTGIKQALGVHRSEYHLFRITGTFFNPGPYSGYIVTIFVMALGYIVMRYRYVSNLFVRFRDLKNISFPRVIWMFFFVAAAVAAGTILIILPSTMSRAAYVSAMVAVMLIFFGERKVFFYIVDYFRRYRRKCITISIALLILLCGGVYGIYTIKKDSADGRLLMWKISAKVMFNNSLIGTGPDYFRGAYGNEQADYFRSSERSDTETKVAGSLEYGFNEYLQIGMETGVTGLILFLILVFTAFLRLFQTRSTYAFGLIALLVFAFFSYPFSILPLKVLLVLFLALAGSQRAKHRTTKSGEVVLTGIILTGSLVAAIFLINPFFNRVEAVKEWKRCRRWYSMEHYSNVLRDYPQLFSLMKENPAFLFEYGRSLHMKGEYRKSLEILYVAARQSADPMIYNVIGNNYKALEEYDKAAKAYLKAYYIIPHRVYPVYLLAKMYAEIGDVQNASYYARWMLDIAPKIESPATREMQQEMEQLLQNTL